MKGTCRHEFKYNISFADYQILKPRLNSIMKSGLRRKNDSTFKPI